MIEVPFLTQAHIEAETDILLEEFGRKREPILAPPVPLEKLLYYLGLRLHMDDLHARLGVPRTAGRVDILAALWIEDREIRIDESLDPEVKPEVEGRYHFSIGHEVGHRQLHRHQILAASTEPVLFMQPHSPTVCRNEDLSHLKGPNYKALGRMELQANRFSACLLMPKFLVLAAWQRRFKSLDPVFVEDRRRIAPELPLLLPRTARDRKVAARSIAHRSLEKLISDIASEFRSSRQAMRVRLHQLGLIHP
jgi:Zn-dependent peptidase ImmA (M78 family)